MGVNYVGNQAPNGVREHQAPPPQEGTLELMMRDILDGQKKNAQEVNEKITALENKMDIMNNEFSYKLEDLTCRVDFLDSRAYSTSEIKSPSTVKKIERKVEDASTSVTELDRSIPLPTPDSQVKNAAFDSGNIQALPMRKLPKLEDPGKFVVPCSIFGVDFEDSICDSGSTVNLMSRGIAESLGIANLQPSQMFIRFANASIETPQGCIKDLQVQIRNCLMPTDFQVVEMSNDSYMSLILGRSFLATAGALVDLPNKRVCLSNISKNIFYDAVLENDRNYGFYIAI